MPISKNKKLVLESHKKEVEAIVKASVNGYPLVNRELKKILQNIINLKFYEGNIGIDDLKTFLVEESRLHKIAFQTPRTETLYIWDSIDKYTLLSALRPNGYYSHLTAMHLHGLIDYEPESIFFNNEQSARLAGGNLEQSRIDNAFKKKQRITTAQTNHEGKVYWLLSGKQSGNYGVVHIKMPSGADVAVTNLERTLIDIAVRPAYAGGVNSVLRAYKIAQPNVSITKLSKTLRSLNYVYPYHQSIGFYIDRAGTYGTKAIKEFLAFAPIQYDFYLDYEMQGPAYSQKWKLYYPRSLV
ncbi:MAG: hypothetical protein QY332_20980 [Anaerolineales bacterium]|nr:MAG: hypothetical protein QY332_20980 [Anaerolineales bacterium]